jgi:hypothetical protein
MRPIDPEGLGGADERIRTADLRITNALLYQLSYVGIAHCGWCGGRSLARNSRSFPGRWDVLIGADCTLFTGPWPDSPGSAAQNSPPGSAIPEIGRRPRAAV